MAEKPTQVEKLTIDPDDHTFTASEIRKAREVKR